MLFALLGLLPSAGAAQSAAANALPTNPRVVAGQAGIASAGTRMDVTQTTQKAVINWDSFSIGRSAQVNFVQPNAAAVTLNRVTGGTTSVIDGRLSATGQVFLVNPAGVYFGNGASVSVGGFVASTMNIGDGDFLAGNYRFARDGAAAGIANHGSLSAADGGYVALLAPEVRNEGIVAARLGTIAIGAGEAATLDFHGDQMVGMRVDPAVVRTLIESRRVIEADGGTVILSSQAADELTAGVINLSGHIAAREIGLRAGLTVNTGQIEASATVAIDTHHLVNAGAVGASGSNGGGTVAVNASGRVIQTAAGSLGADGGAGDGGSVTVLAQDGMFLSGNVSATGVRGGRIVLGGQEVALAATRVDASGANRGGDIEIGGTPAAQLSDAVLVNHAAVLDAGARNDGDGGRITVWSRDKTEFFGTARARGGELGGNGGFVEVSGKESYTVAGQLDVAAPRGQAGAALLDPKNIVIDDATGTWPYYELIDPNPAAGNQFGESTVRLANGNVVVTAPGDRLNGFASGAAYVFQAQTGSLLSSLIGGQAGDGVGSSGITALGNGNYVVASPNWSSGAGAVTWGSGATGVTGLVSALNSLVGSQSNDLVGSRSITALTNGNYVVASPNWANGAIAGAGAVTWGNGAAGTTGAVSAANSLVGSQAGDNVASGGVTALANGNYVVNSLEWANGAATRAGAVTWGDGASGTAGAVSALNSLVGSQTDDQIGAQGIVALNNGNYVVKSPYWANGGAVNAGAASWGSGTTGVAGPVGAANSLVGSQANDQVGVGGIVALANGNYVVASPNWADGGLAQAGAATWGNGTTGIAGPVSALNSLVGSQVGDGVGIAGVTALSNGHYVVGSPYWDNGAVMNAGAATWGDGTIGITGPVGVANSLVGGQAFDSIGFGGVTALSNGHYVVSSPFWANGAVASAGAATWGNGAAGTTGTVTALNSLVGSQVNDQIGSAGVTALSNGNYVVRSECWANGAAACAGAATWGDGTGVTAGAVSALNSLVGSQGNDKVGLGGVTALANGNYVVNSHEWANGATLRAGAVTWGNGAAGTAGPVGALNSLVGTQLDDRVGFSGITALPGGNYAIGSEHWHSGTGAVSWGNGAAGTAGPAGAANSLVGAAGDHLGHDAPLTSAADGLVVIRNPAAAGNRGRVLVSSDDPMRLLGNYAIADSQTMTVHSAVVARLLSTGAAVTLQANNDISVNSAVTADNAAGNGGNLSLLAGRGVHLNADITTDNGDFYAGANEGGIVAAQRDPGVANISQAPGTTINAGTGRADFNIANNAAGPASTVTLANVTADTIAIRNDAGSAGGAQFIGNVVANGTVSANVSGTVQINGGGSLRADGAGDAIVLVGNQFDNTAGAGALDATSGRWLIYAPAPGSVAKGGLTSGFRQYNTNYGDPINTATGNGFIYAASPGTLSVTPTVAGGIASHTYGDAPTASFAYSLAGFADSEDSQTNIGVSGGSFDFAPTATTNAGNYVRNYVNGMTSTVGYAFTPAAAGLAYVVGQRPITLQAGSNQLGTRIVGDTTNPAVDVTVSGGSLAPHHATLADAFVSVAAGSAADHTTPDGTYGLGSAMAYKVAYAANANYAVTANDGTLTIGRKVEPPPVCTGDGCGGSAVAVRPACTGESCNPRPPSPYQGAVQALRLDPSAADLPTCLTAEQAAAGDCLETVKDRRRSMSANVDKKHAILIGVAAYAGGGVPPLETPIGDVDAIAGLLQARFGYEPHILRNPTKRDLVAFLNQAIKWVGPDDSLLIYYAGHGYQFEGGGMGYWLPADAESSSPRNWLSNADISHYLSMFAAKQVALLSDSCFSGSLTQKLQVAEIGAADRGRILSRRSVVIMTSGDEEPVSDEGLDGHSIFAWSLLKRLGEVDATTASTGVYQKVRADVTKDYPQTPQLGAALFAGHEQGTDYLIEPAAGTPPAAVAADRPEFQRKPVEGATRTITLADATPAVAASAVAVPEAAQPAPAAGVLDNDKMLLLNSAWYHFYDAVKFGNVDTLRLVVKNPKACRDAALATRAERLMARRVKLGAAEKELGDWVISIGPEIKSEQLGYAGTPFLLSKQRPGRVAFGNLVFAEQGDGSWTVDLGC